MQELHYMVVKVIGNFCGSKRNAVINRWFAKQGIKFKNINNAYIYSNIAKNEGCLIDIGENTTISGNVELITHDNSISKCIPNVTDLFGRIKIGDNCFVVNGAIILYGVTISDNVIIAAGSVVTASVLEENVIVGGNPAKIIGTWNKFAKKNRDFAWNCSDYSRDDLINELSKSERLIKR